MLNKKDDTITTQVLGWVPVAPVSTQLVRAELAGVRVPTMIVYGERDTGLGTASSRDLATIPTSTQPQVRGSSVLYTQHI